MFSGCTILKYTSTVRAALEHSCVCLGFRFFVPLLLVWWVPSADLVPLAALVVVPAAALVVLVSITHSLFFPHVLLFKCCLWWSTVPGVRVWTASLVGLLQGG